MKKSIPFSTVIDLCFLIATGFFYTGCNDACSDVLDVHMISDENLPSWANPGDKPQYKVIIQVDFNKAMDKTSVVAPTNFNVSAKGSRGNEDNDILGDVQFSADLKTAIFISYNPLAFSPGAGEDVTYTIKLIGDSVQCIKRQTGECMDGDDPDCAPGGKFIKSIRIIG